MAGEHEDEQVIGDVVVGYRLTGFGVGSREQCLHQRRVTGGVGAAGPHHLVGDFAHGGDRGAGPAARQRRHPPRRTHRSQGAISGVRRRDVHAVGDRVRTFVEVDAQNRTAQRLHGDPAALQVEIDITAVRPTINELLCGPRHVAAEVSHVVLGEHGLQGPLARSPLLVGQDEQAVARHVPHFVVNDAPLRGCIAAAQNVAHRARGHHRHDRRNQVLGPELDSGDGSTGVADHFLSGVEPSHQLHQLPDRQRVLRHQRQGADVDVRGHVNDHRPVPDGWIADGQIPFTARSS